MFLEINVKKIPHPDEMTVWEDRNFGIRADVEFARYEARSYGGIISDFAAAQLQGLIYTCENAYKRTYVKMSGTQYATFEEDAPLGKAGSVGLVILFHGLNGQPSVWNKHIAFFSEHPEIDCIAPEIPEAGNCSLEIPSFDVMLQKIVAWALQHPLKPIVLFGQSFGSRVATHFEYQLRSHVPTTPVHLFLSGAVLYGSKTVANTGFDQLYSYLRPEYNVFEDLQYGSETSKRLIGNARAPLEDGVAEREYTMFAPYYDHHVYSLGSALPILCPGNQPLKKERHYIVYNCGHNAIPTFIWEKQLTKCLKWINAKQSIVLDSQQEKENKILTLCIFILMRVMHAHQSWAIAWKDSIRSMTEKGYRFKTLIAPQIINSSVS